MSLELLSLGLNFMGGLMGKKSQDRQNRLQMQQAQRQFDAQMDQSVQRRVKDAKAAGVHPLFALGASVGASPTISAQGESRGNPMQSALGAMATALNGLETNKAQAARDHAQAALFDSERKRIEQSLVTEGSDRKALTVFGDPKPGPKNLGVSEIFPAQDVARKPGDLSREAGRPRAPYVDYRRSDGSKGTAFGTQIPGAEELNAFWVPLQNWWHTSKEARRKIREKLGITTNPTAYLRANPEAAIALAQSARAKRLKRELRNFNKAVSGRPIR